MGQTCIQPRVFLLALSLAAGCAEEERTPGKDADMPMQDLDAAAAEGGRSSGHVEGGPQDAATPPTTPAPDASRDSELPTSLDAGDVPRDAAVSIADASPGAMDASTGPVTTPTPAEVYAILDRRCGLGCHNNQGSTGWLFDGRLRNTLFAAVETSVFTDAGAAARDCRRERRIVRGDPNSYFIRKIELWFGRTPNPPVCGAGMPLDIVFSDEDRQQFPLELERLKLWIAAGAPLQ